MFDSRDTKFLPAKVSEIFPKLTHYTVEWCGITEVFSDNFVGLILTHLSLSENEIKKIHEKAFDDLTNLEELSLDRNYLSSLPENIFGRLENLQKLDLDSNKFKEFPKGIFDPLKSLTELKVKHNEIKILDAKIFENLVNVKKILLFGNEIETIKNGEIFKNLKSLSELDLKANTCYNEIISKNDIENILKSPVDCQKSSE